MKTQIGQEAEAVVLFYTTWPDGAVAELAARTLLDERLIACANILASGRSVFRWEGTVSAEAETVALFKTSKAHASDACTRLGELHPYDEPCILALPADTDLSAKGFLDWVAGETS